ncbi:MAG TPA: NADP-dependent oxidoreductase [Sphingobium sp.]|nr:NADP-dependent oxidoreductase [Sphingobium sp.]
MALSPNRQWTLRACPDEAIGQYDFELRSESRPQPAKGEIVLRVHYLAMDPAIRGFMNQRGGYAAPIAPGTPVRGMVLGEVVESRADTISPGEAVWGFGSWSDYVVGPAAQFHRAERQAPGPDLLHRRGTIGLTAHYGLTRIAQIRPGEVILVSGAAGAVGSLVGQMARNLGAGRIVGIAGGAAKCRRAVERYGYDVCLDYKAAEGDLRGPLMAAVPGGVDVYFDNVGGPLQAIAIDLLRKNARMALCGMIADYDGGASSPPPNLWNLVVQTAMIRGFRVAEILNEHALVAEAQDEIEGWIAEGRLHGDLDIRKGLENAPATFLTLFSGGNNGRLLVQVNEDGW